MDPKSKKNLSPELKAVYDRVMNTKITQRPQTAPAQSPIPPQPTTSAQATTQSPQLVPSSIAPPTTLAPQPTLIAETPKLQTQTPEPEIKTETPPSPTPDMAPIEPAGSSGSQEPFLSSLPPRPLNSLSGETFVFSSDNAKSSTQEQKKSEEKNEKAPQTNSSKLSTKIILGLFGLFLVVYSFFWAKIFNLF